MLKKIISSANFFPILVVIFLGILAGRSLLTPGYFNMHDDLQMMRQLEMEKCFRDFQIPCRWAPDMGYGYGFPLFNYYPPLPYLAGEVVRIFGFSFITTVKLTFFLSFVLSGVAMYALGREFWGRLGGVLSAGFYIWAPYHALDVFVRGAMNEAWALVWLPLILWSSYKLVVGDKRQTRRWVITLALSWAALFLTHNIMVLIFTPIFAVWCLLWLWRKKNAWAKIPQLAVSGIWAFGLAAFFSIPVILEQKLVHIETLTVGYYEYIAHFADLNQLFLSRFWGYGASVWGEADKMAFPVGHLHWGLAIAIAVLILFRIITRKKTEVNLLLVTCLFLIAGFAAAFMAHVRSTPIWITFPVLSIVQFPWRFLTIVILSFSFAAGVLAPFLKGVERLSFVIVVVALVGVVWFNWPFFQPERMGPLTDREKFSAAAWELQQTAGIYDYLPKDATIAPQGPRTVALEFVDGTGQVGEVKEGTNWLRGKVSVSSGTAVLRINIFNFPDFRVFVDGERKEVKLLKDDELGRMHVDIPSGEHKVEARLFNTTLRVLGNLISLVSWLVLLYLLLQRRLIARM